METQSSLLDRLLRPLGATIIVVFGLLCIVLSVLMRMEGSSITDFGSKNHFERLLFSTGFAENWFYDLRSSRFYQHSNISPNIVILEIGDESLNRVGRWPWSRTRQAKIVDNLGAYGARVVLFDITFPEPENDAADQAFADAITRFVTTGDRRSVVLAYDLTKAPDEALPELPPDFQISALSGTTDKAKPVGGQNQVNKYNFAAPKLVIPESTFGFISAEADPDGVFRHAKLLAEIQGSFYPSLGLAGFQAFFSNGKDRRVQAESAPQTPDFQLVMHENNTIRKVRLSARGELKLRFFGGERNFTRVNIADVVQDENPAANEAMKKAFAGKVVLIGSSAFGAHDLRHTPIGGQMPGMYMHANIFHSLDQNFFFQEEDASMLISLALYLFGIIGVLFLARFRDPLVETLGTLVLAAGVYSADYFYFAPNGYFIRLFFTLTGIVGLYSWFTILNVFKEAREKKKVRDTFQRYVAPEIVKEMLANPEKLRVGGEKKEITMLFSDVRDFTSISEKLTAHELATLLNIYMGKMTDILFETHGTLDKYIGDALVGFWGAPLDLPDNAYHAVRGAKQMLEALPAINKEFERRKFPKINVGIGLNTGEVSVGNMGSDKIFQYTALGDNMNLASRLESLTKYYGVNLMISEFTYEKLGNRRNEFRMRPLDLVQVKGKSKAVKIYEVIPDWHPLANEESLLTKYVDAYENKYLQRDFKGAIEILDEILSRFPDDKASAKIKHNAEEFLQNPPGADWDGVTVMTSK